MSWQNNKQEGFPQCQTPTSSIRLWDEEWSMKSLGWWLNDKGWCVRGEGTGVTGHKKRRSGFNT